MIQRKKILNTVHGNHQKALAVRAGGVQLLLLLLLLLPVLPCAALRAQDAGGIHLVATSFKERADSLDLSFDVRINASASRTCDSHRLIPILQADGHRLCLPAVEITGRRRAALDRRAAVLSGDRKKQDRNLSAYTQEIRKSDTGDTLHRYTLRIPYELWMDSARLSLEHRVSGCRGESRLYAYSPSGSPRLEVKEPYRVQPALAYLVPEKENKTRRRQGSAYLDFRAGHSVIAPAFRRNPEELAKIDNAVGDFIRNPDVNITALFIEGYASPEGPYAINERLSRERAWALKAYLQRRYGFGDNLFRVSSVAEDWDGLKVLLEASDMPHRDAVLKIIDETGIFEGREARLMALAGGVPYRRMMAEMFPELRRVEYQIDYNVKDYTLEESKGVFTGKPGNLSHRELYLLAQDYAATDSLRYRQMLVETIPRYFPDDEVALVNAAGLLIASGEETTALRLLDKVADNPSGWNNRGAALLKLGELDQAEALFRKARAGGIREATHNLDELARKREDNIQMERFRK